MPSKVNLKTISQDLGLSVATISRILNGKAKAFRISDDTVHRVVAYAREKGYTPNLIAKGLQSSRTMTIGLMIPDISNPFFAHMARHVEMAATQQGYSVLLSDSQESLDKERRQIHIMTQRNIDGIVAAPVGHFFEHFHQTEQSGIPVIFADRYAIGGSIPFVTSANAHGAKAAVELLLAYGHRQIGIICGDRHTQPVQERLQGYMSAIIEQGVKPTPTLMAGNAFTVENGYKSTGILLDQNPTLTAILATSNLIGLGVLQALRDRGLSIPANISLIFFDDQPYFSFIDPPITTIRQSHEAIGRKAIEMLLSRMDRAEAAPTDHYVPTEIIHRQSVRKLK